MAIQEDILAVLRQLRDIEFTEVQIGNKELSVTIRRRGQGAALESRESAAPDAIGGPDQKAAQVESALPATGPRDAVSEAGDDKGTVTVAAPISGIFYCSPRPGERPFVEIGDRVAPDTTVCIIEVMKLMNSVTAGLGGIVEAVLVEDGTSVEKEAALVRIRRDDGT